MDILLGYLHVDIRLSVVEQLDQLCQTISTGGWGCGVGGGGDGRCMSVAMVVYVCMWIWDGVSVNLCCI